MASREFWNVLTLGLILGAVFLVYFGMIILELREKRKMQRIMAQVATKGQVANALVQR